MGSGKPPIHHSQPAVRGPSVLPGPRPSPHPHSPHLSHTAGAEQRDCGGALESSAQLSSLLPSRPPWSSPPPTRCRSQLRARQIFAQELQDLKGIQTSRAGFGAPSLAAPEQGYSKEEQGGGGLGRRAGLGETLRRGQERPGWLGYWIHEEAGVRALLLPRPSLRL